MLTNSVVSFEQPGPENYSLLFKAVMHLKDADEVTIKTLIKIGSASANFDIVPLITINIWGVFFFPMLFSGQ